MKKYTEEELAELAKGVFKDDKESPVVYADEFGTFRNSVQYEALKKEGKHTPFKYAFKNPSVKQSQSVDADKHAARISDLESQIEDLQDERDAAQEKAEGAAKTIDSQRSKIAALETDLSIAEGRIKALEQDLSSATASLAEAKKEVADLEKKLKAAEKKANKTQS
jgi:peptidoglycan hydrolase CwlO-like protein